MAKHGGMYDQSPMLKRSEEGHMKVEKSSPHNTESDKEEKDEGMPVHARHSHERHLMHAKHEHEHSLHDHQHGASGKEEMHERHEKERKEMHTRHEKEGHHGGEDAGKGGATGEPVEKIEKNAKG